MNISHPFYQEDLNYITSLEGIESLSGKTILITGATGLIGSCLIDALMKFNEHSGDIRVIAVGRNKAKAESKLGRYFSRAEFSFLEQDVRDPFPEDIKPDFIIPLASNTHPLAYSQYPVETIEINVRGAENALKKAVECNACVLYPSTVEIYGNGDETFDENYTGKLNLSTSRSCYTESKRVAEALCQSYIAEHNANCKIVRLSRIFGPTVLSSDTKASSQFISKALSNEDIILKSTGTQLFSYTYVADAVQAILFVMLNGKNGEAYNIAADGCNVRLRDFAEACAAEAGTKVVFDMPSEAEQKGYSIAAKAIMSTKKLANLGWRAHYSFIDAIRQTISILKSR